MTRLERFYRIHGLLRSARQPVPMRRLIEELGVTRNTITRDFEYLRDFFGAPIVYDRDRNGHYYDPEAPEFELPGFWMNASELYALLACEQLLETVQPGLMAQRLTPIRQRIQKLLGDASEHETRLGQKVRLLPVLQRPVDNPVFIGIADATLANTCLRIRYRARSHDRSGERTVHPQRLLHYRHNWYLLAYCEKAGDLRLFSLDRIEMPQMDDRPYKQIDAESLEAFIGDSFGLFSGAPSNRAELRFSPRAARWVADELWHPDQRGEWRDDGYYLWVPYSDPTELIMEVLRHGPDVEVLGPPELRMAVRKRLEGALMGYVGKQSE
ncbi:Transcriptional regulator [Alloalcanivorax xenomutans]|uniref:helix-turn-helix transcriptional regulator n=1 Tax=Alloalcanivorax xenomutans TaxID=1094342 RepID=UPI0006D5C4F3|nr:YafY family protein [Alloalcanivorax xenomutans]PHS68848.1 MAG: YafY family transcriptional regulator [Alcanivorax sp.]CUR48767.1 Transcriptional regulator [Alloalcanivorax xenomutans]